MKNQTNINYSLSLLLLIFAVLGCSLSNESAVKEEAKTPAVQKGSGVETKADLNDKNVIKDDSQTVDKKDETPKKPEKPEKKGNGIETIYTDLDPSKCKMTDSNEEEEWSIQECPGVAGYKLEVSEGDLRQTINVIAPSGGKHELRFQEKISPMFSSFGKKAEWRVKKVNGKTQPIGLITRFNVSENSEDASKLTSYLVVTKFDGEYVCITDVVKPIKNANEKARKLADVAASKPCLQSK